MLKLFSLLAALFIASCATSPQDEPPAEARAPVLEQIADDVWIHKSWNRIEPWGLVLSQGLVVRTEGGLALVDTAWTDEDTAALLTAIEKETGALPDIAIVTHAHDDKMGGMKTLQQNGIGGRAHPLTNADAPGRGLRPTMFSILADSNQTELLGAEGEDGVIAYYPGPGHTRDNIVVYYAPAKVLFGGCLIRPGESNTLGNTADGDVGHWAEAVRNVAAAFPEAELVIPSHGRMGGRELLDHTIALAEKAAATP